MRDHIEVNIVCVSISFSQTGVQAYDFVIRFHTSRNYIEDFTASLKAQISQLIFVITHGRAIWLIVKIVKEF